MIFATPTFLKTYTKRITKEQFGNLNLAIVGAEKMPLSVAKAFEVLERVGLDGEKTLDLAAQIEIAQMTKKISGTEAPNFPPKKVRFDSRIGSLPRPR